MAKSLFDICINEVFCGGYCHDEKVLKSICQIESIKERLQEKLPITIQRRYLDECKSKSAGYTFVQKFKDMIPHGDSIMMLEDDLVSHTVFDNGHFVKQTEFYPSGQISKVEKIKGNIRIVKMYSETGTLLNRSTYTIAGCKLTETIFYTNGGLKEQSTYKLNRLDGPQIKYAVDGTISQRTEYKNGAIDGRVESYKNNLHLVSDYKNNLLHGSSRLFDNNKLVYSMSYVNGRLDGPFTRVENGMVINGICRAGQKQKESFYLGDQLQWTQEYKNGRTEITFYANPNADIFADIQMKAKLYRHVL